MVNHLATLNQLLAAINEQVLAQDIDITGIENHSGRVQAGHVFIAYQGHASDGKRYIAQAIEKGAVALIVDKVSDEMNQLEIPIIEIPDLQSRLGEIASAFWCNPSAHLKVIGITATNGKSTTAYLMTQMLVYLGHRAMLIGTLGTGELDSLELSNNTTPDAFACQKLFAHCRENGIGWVVMEVSSIAVEQGRIAGTRFDLSVFLNLTQDHLDYHGSMQAYANEKKRFIENYGVKKLVNADDAVGQEMLRDNTNIIGFGQAAKAYKQVSKTVSIEGLSLVWFLDGYSYEFKSTLLGEFNIENLMAVTVGLVLLGFDAEELQQFTPRLKAPTGRVELFNKAESGMAIVDYAHTPDALDKLLDTVNPLVRGEVLLVVGCGGDRDKEKRPLMAAIAENKADKVWFTADNPRSESAQSIVEDMLAGVKAVDEIKIELNREKAIQLAAEQLTSDDLLVVAGKGHEHYQEVQGVRKPFSDQAVLQAMGFQTVEVA